MASIPVAAKAPSKPAVGAKFVKSNSGATVSIAKNRGEHSVGPSHCQSKRKAFSTSYGGGNYR